MPVLTTTFPLGSVHGNGPGGMVCGPFSLSCAPDFWHNNRPVMSRRRQNTSLCMIIIFLFSIFWDIYLFNVPDTVAKDGDQGVVFKYRGRHSKRNFTFISIPDGFIEIYREFISNPYQFISDNFSNYGWDSKYPELLHSDTDRVERILKEYKYTDGLTDNPRDILMWGHYGDSNKGVCLNHTAQMHQRNCKNRKTF